MLEEAIRRIGGMEFRTSEFTTGETLMSSQNKETHNAWERLVDNATIHEEYEGTFVFGGFIIEYKGYKRDWDVLGNTPEENAALGQVVVLTSQHKMGAAQGKTLEETKRRLGITILMNQDASNKLHGHDKNAWHEYRRSLGELEVVDL